MSTIETPIGEEESGKPLVGSTGGGRGIWLFGAGLAMGAAALFYSLETHRTAMTVPAITAAPDKSAGFIGAPPALDIPSAYEEGASAHPIWAYSTSPAVMPAPAGAILLPPQASPARLRQGPASTPQPAPPRPDVMAGQIGYQSPPVYQPSPATAPEAATLEGTASSESGKERVEAARFANPATTVPKGTVIQVVLETALDSTRAGFARAIVSRDVFGFDGSKILIPRGSRIIGEYKSDVTRGQNRVLIQWQRLMRPDGSVINMDSPSADPLGRAGIQGKVNSHFFERFAGSILQSALDVGTQLATREVSRDAFYIGLPGLTQGAIRTPENIQPTVKVRQGRSVSVFVARDLDFTKVSL